MFYKNNFVIYWINNLASVMLVYFLWKAILKNNNTVNMGQQVVYLIIAQILVSIMPEVIYQYNNLVQSGDMAYKLLLPVKFEFNMLFDTFGFSIAKLVIILPIDLAAIYVLFPEVLSISSILLLLILLPIAFILGFAIELCFSSITLFTYSVWGVNTIKTAILMVLSGAYFPLGLLPGWMQAFIKLLPFSYVYGGLVDVILNPSMGEIIKLLGIQSMWIILLVGVYNIISKRGLNKFTIQGG